MNHEHDPLEAELAALRPQAPSAELAETISRRLAPETSAAGQPSPGRCATTLSRRERVLLALAGTVVAAGVILAVVLWRGEGAPDAKFPVDPPQALLASAFDDSLPSLWTYRDALTSPEELDSLLDKHSRLAPAHGNPEQTRGFVPMTMDLNSRLGGL